MAYFRGLMLQQMQLRGDKRDSITVECKYLYATKMFICNGLDVYSIFFSVPEPIDNILRRNVTPERLLGLRLFRVFYSLV